MALVIMYLDNKLMPPPFFNGIAAWLPPASWYQPGSRGFPWDLDDRPAGTTGAPPLPPSDPGAVFLPRIIITTYYTYYLLFLSYNILLLVEMILASSTRCPPQPASREWWEEQWVPRYWVINSKFPLLIRLGTYISYIPRSVSSTRITPPLFPREGGWGGRGGGVCHMYVIFIHHEWIPVGR